MIAMCCAHTVGLFHRPLPPPYLLVQSLDDKQVRLGLAVQSPDSNQVMGKVSKINQIRPGALTHLCRFCDCFNFSGLRGINRQLCGSRDVFWIVVLTGVFGFLGA
jgi:hypothetical protein